MAETSATRVTGFRLSRLVSFVLGAFRTTLGYLTFTATLFTALTLLVRRDFSNVVLSVMENWLAQLGQVAEMTDRIVAAWHEIVVGPLAMLLGAWLDWCPSLLAVEVATLALFAVGPSLRAVWTAHKIEFEIRRRLLWITELRSAQGAQAEAIRELKNYRSELQASYDDRNWSRAKKVGEALGGFVLAGFSLLRGGGSLAFVQPLAQKAWESFSSWDEVQARIRALGKDVESLEAEQARIDRQIEALSARDNHLIGRLSAASADDAATQIRAHVADRMRIAVALSRIALGVVLAVVLAYLIEWTWPGL